MFSIHFIKKAIAFFNKTLELTNGKPKFPQKNPKTLALGFVNRKSNIVNRILLHVH